MTGRRVVVVDHHDSYTWNLVHLVAGVTGTLPAVVQHDEVVVGDLGAFSHVVLSPGPGRPDEPRDFALGRAVFELGRPVLGVCLGMQALVHLYGGHVGQVEPAHGEVASVEHDGSGAFAGLPSPFAAVRYHSLAVLDLPDVLRPTAWCADPAPTWGSERRVPQLVTGQRDGAVLMGVEHRDLPLWGVQFHPESVLTEHGPRLLANFLELG